MKNILIVTEESYILSFLEKRNLVGQYKKAKMKILTGVSRDIKLREPKKDGVWYFRINKQFRAYARIENGSELVIFEIDNHQNG